MRIAIIGGSFNPPHIGHMILIEEILATECYQRVLLIPAKAAPHKVPQMDPGPEMRLALLEASIEGWHNVAIEDCELRRAGLSYTSDTLEELWNRRLFDERPGLVIGDDLATDFLATWKRAEKILELADIIVDKGRGPAWRGGGGDKYLPFLEIGKLRNISEDPCPSLDYSRRTGRTLQFRLLPFSIASAF